MAVFIPLLFMGGLVGRLFHEFAVTLSLAILVSGVISLTFTPMMCSRFLKPESAYGAPGSFYRAERSAASTALHRSYERGLDMGAPPSAVMLLVALVTHRHHRRALRHGSQGFLSRSRTPA